MRKLIFVLITFSTILLCSSAFADTNSRSETSVSKSDTELSRAYYHAHAAGMMSLVIRGGSKLTFADVLRLIRKD